MLASKPRTIESVNPATGAVIETFPLHTEAEIEAILERAKTTQKEWSRRSFAERSALMRKAGAALRSHKTEYALHMTREMGKPVADAEAEVEKCALACDYYAEHAEKFLSNELIKSAATESYVSYQPLGVVLAVMPWNFPFWQVFRFAAPALMAGNTGILKHASNVSRCAYDIEHVFLEAGFPAGAFTTVLVPGGEVKKLIADDRIAAVTLTGSEPAGVSVASEAGRVLKKCVLELGGSDAFIVLADADIPLAAKTAAKARYQNAGQSCICGKRFIVEDAVYDTFVKAFVEEAKTYTVGDPEQRDTKMGPLARADLLDDLNKQLAAAVKEGGKVVLGGKQSERGNCYFDATVVVDVDDQNTIFKEETFGPIAAIVRAKDAEHAVALANDSIFGLGGALWTGNIERGKQLARRIESGAVFINGMTASDPRLPFGGIKHSGYGRELSYLGIREFMNIQTVWIGPAQEVIVVAD